MITGKITLDNVKGFSVNTVAGVTELRLNDGESIIEGHLTEELATDIANALRRSVALPGERVTGKQMREMRAKDAAGPVAFETLRDLASKNGWAFTRLSGRGKSPLMTVVRDEQRIDIRWDEEGQIGGVTFTINNTHGCPHRSMPEEGADFVEWATAKLEDTKR